MTVVLGVVLEASYDIALHGERPVLIDVTDLGAEHGYRTLKEMRDAFRAAARLVGSNEDRVMANFDQIAKRLLKGTLLKEDVVHHSKL